MGSRHCQLQYIVLLGRLGEGYISYRTYAQSYCNILQYVQTEPEQCTHIDNTNTHVYVQCTNSILYIYVNILPPAELKGSHWLNSSQVETIMMSL